MRKIIALFVSLVVLLSMSACKNNTGTYKKPDSANGQDFMHSVCNKDYVPEFMTIVGNIQGEGLLSGANFSEDSCYNVTPTMVSEQTEYKIFKFANTCSSFVLIDGAVYELCASFGGYGFVNAVTCDFDLDGNIDLLVASSWGSGMHRSQISIFNTKTKESTILYDTSETDNPNIDLIVSIQKPSSDNGTNPLPVYYVVHSVTINANLQNLADLSYCVNNTTGAINVENGKPYFFKQ